MSLYTNTEYDNFSGYVERIYSIPWMDQEGRHWLRTCTVINLGRCDRGVSSPDPSLRRGAGPDVLLEPVLVEGTGAAGRSEYARLAAARHAVTEKVLEDYLTRNGPCKLQRLMTAAGRARDFMRGHIAAREAIYCRIGSGCVTKWGLVGMHDREGTALD